MARDEGRRNRYGRRGRGGREQQNQYNPNQPYNQSQQGGRDDWNRQQGSRDDWNRQQGGREDWDRQQEYGGRPSGSPNWQHDYSYGGSRREFESEGPGREWSTQGRNNPSNREQWSGNRDRSNQGQWSGQGQWLDHRSYRGSEYRGEFGENRPMTWPEQRGSYGERDYGQGEGGYGEGGLGSYGESARGWGREPDFFPQERSGTGRQMPYYGETGYTRENYSSLTPDRGYVMPPIYQDFMGTGVPWQGHRPQPGMANQGYAGRGPKGYKRPDDRIHEEICELLTRHPAIDASDIEIKVENGEVTLNGTVHERRVKHMVEDAAESVSGVRDVKNDIKVDKDPPGFSREWEQGVDNGRTSHDEEEKSTRGRRERTTSGR